jgi:hypothetical protein
MNDRVKIEELVGHLLHRNRESGASISESRGQSNCWGSVSWVLGLDEVVELVATNSFAQIPLIRGEGRPGNVSRNAMRQFLKHMTNGTMEEESDILAFYSKKGLMHCGVNLGDGLMFQQNGTGGIWQVVSIRGYAKEYGLKVIPRKVHTIDSIQQIYDITHAKRLCYK